MTRVATTPSYDTAWRDRRRRMAVFRSIQIAFIPVIVGAAFASRRLSDAMLLLLVATWFVAYMVAGVWLNRFRCPRCGQLYYWRLERKGYIDRLRKWRDCRHCGLEQDTSPD